MLRTGYFAVSGAASAVPPDVAYVRRWANSTNGTLYTSTTGSLGRAVDRLVVVVVNGTINGGGANSGITGGTIGGVAATVYRGQVDTPTGSAYAQTDFLVASLPANNTSGTVTITYAGLHSSCVMNVYDIVGEVNPFPTIYQGAGNATSKNVALASHKAAAAIGGGSSMAVTVNSWTITSDGKPVIKDDQATIRSNGSCAMHMLDASGAPTITFTPESAGAQLAAAVAVFENSPIPFGISLQGQYETGSNLSTYTYANAPLGAPDPGRGILVGVALGGQSQSIGTVTVGGVAATELSQTPTGNWASGLYYADVPEGTAANVVVTTVGGSGYSVSIDVWSIYGHDPASIDTDVTYVSNGTQAQTTLDIPADGLAQYFCVQNGSRNANWSSAIETFDKLNIGDSSGSRAHAYKLATTAQPGHVETVTTVSSATQMQLHAVSWGPK